MELKGKVAIVTGGGRGIGEAIAQSLMEKGVRVVVNDLVREEAERVAGQLIKGGGEAFGLQADVSDETQVREFVKKVVDRFGEIDILVNNAGLLILHEGKKAAIWEMELEEWDRVMGVNLKGTFLCSKYVLREMIKIHKTGRRIINLSSGAAKLGGMISSCAYIASKAGIIGFTKVMAREAAPYGITVNAVAPGLIEAPMMRLSTPPSKDRDVCKAVPLARLGTPGEVAETILFLASDSASYITGATLDVNGGWVMD